MKTFLKVTGSLFLFVFVNGCQPSFISLYDGKSLDGWECEPSEKISHWKAQGDEIVGENPDKIGSILWTTQFFKDFELVLDYKTPSDDYDSGVFLRGESHQIQIGVSRSLKKDLTGCIYCPKDEKGKYPVQLDDKVEKFHKLGEWNHLRIIVKGKQIQTFLNDEPFIDYEAVVIPGEGPLGLQLHPNVDMKMQFKNIKIREIED